MAAILRALPVGVAAFDAEQRLMLANPAFCAAVSLPPDRVTPGTPLSDLSRFHSDDGKCEPEAATVAAETLHVDVSRPQHRRQRHANGRIYDLLSTPLPQGGHVRCTVEATPLPWGEEAAASQYIDASPPAQWIGVASFAANRTLVMHNPRFAELLLLDPDGLRRGLRFSTLVRKLSRSREYDSEDGRTFLAVQLSLDRSRPSRLRRSRRDGRVIEVASDPLPGGGWTMVVLDVTPVADGNRESAHQAAILDSILAFIPHGICVYGADRRLTMFNPAYAEIMKDAPVAIGDSVEEVIRRRAVAGEFGPGDPDQIIRRQLGHDLSRPQMRRRRRPNGTAIDVRTAPLPDGGHISIVTDITLLTQAEEEVARRAAEMDTMLASIRHGIVLMGPDRRVISSNPIATKLLGHPPGLLVPGRHQAEIIDHMLARGEFLSEPDPISYARERLQIDRRKPHSSRRRTALGRMLEVRSDPAPDGGFVITYTDVTETEAAEAELRRAKATAEASNQAKSRFLATMSHELRTPLNAVIGFSESLLRESGGTPDADRVCEFAQEINDAGRQLLSLINNILDVSRIDAGRFDLSADRVDLARLLQACVRQFDQAARAAEVSLSVQLPKDSPEIRADERRLQQVIANLLSNAIKFTEAGGTVTLTATRDESGTLTIQVTDTGIGIPPSDLERVFEPFIQLDESLNRRFQGAGLGLYVSRALVEAQGGKLTLSSKPDVGTVAEIRIPQPSASPAPGDRLQERP
jgi:signal transduction histidine kinase